MKVRVPDAEFTYGHSSKGTKGDARACGARRQAPVPAELPGPLGVQLGAATPHGRCF